MWRALLAFFSGISAPHKEARRLVARYGMDRAREQAIECLRFAALYGAPGEEAYWEAVLQILLKSQR